MVDAKSVFFSRALLFSMLFLLQTNVGGSQYLGYYAVQVKPIVFINEPQSQLLMEQETLVLSCQARIARLISDQPLPVVNWWRNGTEVERNALTKIYANLSSGHSELIVQNISTELSGLYQCVASDANGRYITVSKKATVTVLSQDFTLIKAYLGQALLLKCSPMPGFVTLWQHEGRVINQTTLSTGDLFIPTITADHKGIWQCYSFYNVTVMSSAGKGHTPVLIIDANSSDMALGTPIRLYCDMRDLSTRTVLMNNVTLYFRNKSNQQKEAQVVDIMQTNLTLNYEIMALGKEHIGSYFCSVDIMINNGTNMTLKSETFNIFLKDSLLIHISSKEVDIYLEHETTSAVILTCDFECDLPCTMYWTRNGYVLANDLATFDPETGNITLSKEGSFDLFGLYQCHVESAYAAEYTVTRILVKYLSNPPGELNIAVQNNISYFFLPYMNISWKPPVQRGNMFALTYSISAHDTLNFNSATINKMVTAVNSTTIDLPADSVYLVTISVAWPNIQSLPTECIVDTTERFFSVNKPFDYLFCTNDGRVIFKWTPLDSKTEFVTINGNCLHNGELLQFQLLQHQLSNHYTAEPFDQLSPGTVCEFHGQYRYGSVPQVLCNNDEVDFYQLARTYYYIPRKSCQIEGDTIGSTVSTDSTVKLSMICDIDEIKIIWFVPNELFCELVSSGIATFEITGLCMFEGQITELNHTVYLMNETTGNIIFGNLPAQSICSFAKNTSDLEFMISPGQCMLGAVNRSSFSGLTQIHSAECNSLLSSTSHFLPGGISSQTLAVLESVLFKEGSPSIDSSSVIIAFAVSAFIILAAVVAVFPILGIILIFRKYRQAVKRSWTLNEFEVSTKFSPSEDVWSMKTDVDSLCYEQTRTDDYTVYNGYAIQHRHKVDTTGSSGYGSGYGSVVSPESSDYHSKKLDEIEDEDLVATHDSMSVCSDERNASLPEDLNVPKANDNVVMCVQCRRIQYKGVGSMNDLCLCMGSEGYVRLHRDLSHDHQIGHKDWLNNSRLSALSV